MSDLKETVLKALREARDKHGSFGYLTHDSLKESHDLSIREVSDTMRALMDDGHEISVNWFTNDCLRAWPRFALVKELVE